MKPLLLIVFALATLQTAAAGQSGNDLFQKALSKERVDGQLAEAIALYEAVEQRDIFLLHADGSSEIRLVEHAANDFHAIWTPDGKGVLFTSDRSGVASLWLIRVDNGKPRGAPELVKTDIGRSFPLGFTREGVYYYGSNVGAVDVSVVSLDPVSGRPSSAPEPISDRFVGANSAPDWSPDGQSLLYIAQRGLGFTGALDTARLTIRALVSGEERVLSTGLRAIFRPRWSPDGRSVLVWGIADENGQEGLHRIDAAQGGHSLLYRPTASYDREGEWAPDGRSVFVHASDAAGSHVMRRGLDADEPQELYRAPASASLSGLSIAPDGRHLAFRMKDIETGAIVLVLLPTVGGEPMELLRLAEGESIPGSVVRTRRAEPMNFTMRALRDIRVKPDGTALAVSAGEYQAEVWVMENFLPAAARLSPVRR